MAEASAARGAAIPAVLILTTLALLAAQLRPVQALGGADLLGTYGAYLFLAVIGAYCDLASLAELGRIGALLALFVGLAVLIHGLVAFGGGALIGIEPEVMGRLFNPFEQGEQTVTRKFGGLGLGLSIARQLVELHGGTLTAASEGKGRGATFTISLLTAPTMLPAPETAPPPAGRPKPRAGLAILLVEDHPDTLRMMTRLLQHMGHQVESASSVAEAIAISDGRVFDLLLSDIGLPDGSGLDVVRDLSRRRTL